MGYGKAVEDIVAPSQFGCIVVHAKSAMVLGSVARSSCIRVSLHQNLENSMNVIKLAIFPTGETDYPPKRCLTITCVLTLPLDHIQDMQNAVLSPIMVKNAI